MSSLVLADFGAFDGFDGNDGFSWQCRDLQAEHAKNAPKNSVRLKPLNHGVGGEFSEIAGFT